MRRSDLEAAAGRGNDFVLQPCGALHQLDLEEENRWGAEGCEV